MPAILPADIHMNGFYNKKETAKILGIGRSTLDAHIAKGEIRVVKRRYSKKKVSIKGSEIIRFFNAVS